MNKPVYVVIPTFQRTHYIKELLQDLEEQTYPNIRPFICSDGPDPYLQRIINQYNSKRFKIEYIELEQHYGHWGSKCRRTILTIIEPMEDGYVVFVDDDNEIYSTYIKTLVRQMSDNVEFTYCQVYDSEKKIVLPLDEFGIDGLDSLNFMVSKRLAVKYKDKWEDRYDHDNIFYHACLNDTKCKRILQILAIHTRQYFREQFQQL